MAFLSDEPWELLRFEPRPDAGVRRFWLQSDWVTEEEFGAFDPGDGPVFTDGSCLRPAEPHAACAGAFSSLPCCWRLLEVTGDAVEIL